MPCNQFGGQEPGTAEDIQEFCSTSFGVTFPMTEKIEVNGEGRHPLYEQLTPHATASGKTGDIQWNFEKFLVAGRRRGGRPVQPSGPARRRAHRRRAGDSARLPVISR